MFHNKVKTNPAETEKDDDNINHILVYLMLALILTIVQTFSGFTSFETSRYLSTNITKSSKRAVGNGEVFTGTSSSKTVF